MLLLGETLLLPLCIVLHTLSSVTTGRVPSPKKNMPSTNFRVWKKIQGETRRSSHFWSFHGSISRRKSFEGPSYYADERMYMHSIFYRVSWHTKLCHDTTDDTVSCAVVIVETMRAKKYVILPNSFTVPCFQEPLTSTMIRPSERRHAFLPICHWTTMGKI